MSKLLSSCSVHYTPTVLPEGGWYSYTYHTLGNAVVLRSSIRWTEGEEAVLNVDGNTVTIEPTLSGNPAQRCLLLLSTSIPYSTNNTLVVGCDNPDIVILPFGCSSKEGNSVSAVGVIVPMELTKVDLYGFLIPPDGVRPDTPYSKWTLYNLFSDRGRL